MEGRLGGGSGFDRRGRKAKRNTGPPKLPELSLVKSLDYAHLSSCPWAEWQAKSNPVPNRKSRPKGVVQSRGPHNTQMPGKGCILQSLCQQQSDGL